MHLAHLRLRDFRNYDRLDADFSPGFHLLLGRNAQGKTNLLEAVYLMSTLRSFRGVGSAQLVRQGKASYFVGGRVVGVGTHDIRMAWSRTERRLRLDQQPVKRLTDYLGTLRTVVFCTEDLQLVKGAGRIRRRFMDLLLSQAQPSYLPLLQRYMRAVRSRNTLLKQSRPDTGSLDGFSAEMVKLGNDLMHHRRTLVPRLADMAGRAFDRIAPDAEELRIEYQPRVKADFAEELDKAHTRELAQRTTLIGPHRDDLKLQLNERSAADYASEGQKRTVAIALKMAQAEYLTETHGAPPVLLIDDVMGELDASRRAGFLPLLQRSGDGRGQVFMTCTEENWPRELGEKLNSWQVEAGQLNPSGSHDPPS
ncbi:MAG: DNA replication/repair protein RecF [Verrucomicrobiales bacterium]|nr:DNA replication/repair protein RecF [Verrucomicrobiales bacterium]